MPKTFVAKLSRIVPRRYRNRWLWLKFGPFVLAALLLAVAWAFVLLRFEHEEQLVRRHASSSQQNVADIVTENLRQVLDQGQLYALVAGQWFVRGEQSADFNLAAMLAGNRAYNRIALYDAAGGLRFASSGRHDDERLNGLVRSLVADRSGNAPNLLWVAPGDAARGEAWQVPLLYPILDAAGRPLGALLLHLDMGYLLHVYDDIDIGHSGMIQVLEAGGVELARVRRGGLEVVDGAAASARLPDGSARGTRVVELFGQRGPYVSSFNRLEGYPFAVAVSRQLDDVLSEFSARKRKDMGLIVVLSVIALLVAFGVFNLVRRQESLFEAMASSEQEKQNLIDQLETEKRRAYDLASHDHLTGLANRRMFMELGASHLSRARRSRQHYAVLFIDLDRFKTINDTLGHRVGDLLLQVMGRRLRETLRQSDVIARFGGDEFVVLLTGLENETDVVAIVEKLVDVMSQPCCGLDGHDVRVWPSIGISLFPRDGQDLEKLIRHADAAMYESKRASRGSFTFFDPVLNVNSAHEFELEQRLHRAIADDEFVLHFQPKVELKDFRIVGFEALVRWDHPEHGLIFPNRFIPLAEATGHIVELGNWVIEAACRQLADWRRDGVPLQPIAVNISARQLRDKALPQRIADVLSRHGLDAALLQVEVTESSLMDNIEFAGAILDEIAAAGVSVALDDFGNGFSSLGYIKTLPIDTIKIDRGFIRDIQNSPDDAIIVESTITLAHNLGMKVVAEGIETRDQLIHVRTAQCDAVQGYYFSRAVAADAARTLLEQVEIVPA